MQALTVWWKLLILLTHCNGDCVLFPRIFIIAFYFNPEMKRPLLKVTLLKGINLQWTVLLSDVSHQIYPIPILLHYFRHISVTDEVIWCVGPHPSECTDSLPWIWVVKWAGNHHTRSKETFNRGWYLNGPRWGFSLNNCNQMQRKMWWNKIDKAEADW